MKSDLQKFLVSLVFPILGSIVIGFVLFGGSIFQMRSVTFQFIAFGIIGGLMLATTRVAATRRSLVVLVILTVFYELILTPSAMVNVVRDVLFLIGIGLTIILYRSFFYKRMDGTSIARPLVLGAMLALNGVIVTTILQFIIPLSPEGSRDVPVALFQNLGFEFLIGLGLGIGDELSEFSKQRWQLLFQGRA